MFCFQLIVNKMQQQQILPMAPQQPGTPTGSGRAMSIFDKQKYIGDYNFPYCDESSKYEKVTKIGQGTFGEVFKAREKKGNKKFVAMKKVLMENEKEELLLGDRNYGPPVDMWGAGCIMAELWTRSPIMQGNTEQQQLTLIYQLCGSFTPEVWPGVQELELYKTVELPKNQKRRVKERLRPYVKDAYGCDLLDKLLTLDPKKRIDADTALNHDFFWTDPMPCDLGKMLSQHSTSMFEYVAQSRRTNQMRNYHQPMVNINQKPPDNTMIDRVW
uniref:Protein kinase domain-containing protein n=1 Tax=Glossina brevipalpis TaxID=37001 RepID=A0A1A9WQQ9_9MUSC